MTAQTPRLAMPLLEAGQAQKELYHNEALAILDALAQPVVQTLGDNAPPSAPAEGASWVVGAAPTGAWAGQAQAIATWGAGGWRFAAPFEGMTAWMAGAGLPARFSGGVWTVGVVAADVLRIGGNQVVAGRQPAIADPAGGATVDTAARATLAQLLAALRTHGLIGS